MSKKPSSSQHLYPKIAEYKSSQPSPSSLKRRSIHQKSNYSEESSEEDIHYEEEGRKDIPPKPKELYPDLHEKGGLENFQNQQNKETESFNTSKENRIFNRDVKEINKSSWFQYFRFIVVIFFIVCVSIFYCYFYDNAKYRKKTELNLAEIIRDMQNNFKYQHSLTYRFLNSQLKKVVNVTDEPSAPAVITFIVNERVQHIATEFSVYLAKALAPEEYVSINGSAYSYKNPDEIKLKIDESIKYRVQKNKLNVIIIDKLQNIPFEVAMIFHGYCDHLLAPYKRAVFLFIVSVDEIIPETANSKHLDSLVMKHLQKTWKSATFDKLEPLITRLTVAVINIR